MLFKYLFFVFSLITISYSSAPLIVTKTLSTKAIANINKGIQELQGQKDFNLKEISLNKYILAKKIASQNIFSNHTNMYKLYLYAIVNKGTPYLLKNDMFIFQSASNENKLKQLQKYYLKEYGLSLFVYKNPLYNKKTFFYYTKDHTGIINYLMDIKKKHVMLLGNTHQNRFSNPKANIYLDRKNIYNIQHGIISLEKQLQKQLRSTLLKKYLLVKSSNNTSLLQNYYIYALALNNKPFLLKDNRFVFTTLNNLKKLQKLQKLYKKKFNLILNIEKNSDFQKRKFNLKEFTILTSTIQYLNQHLSKYYRYTKLHTKKKKKKNNKKKRSKSKKRKYIPKKYVQKKKKLAPNQKHKTVKPNSTIITSEIDTLIGDIKKIKKTNLKLQRKEKIKYY